jgi:hypothetical protein
MLTLALNWGNRPDSRSGGLTASPLWREGWFCRSESGWLCEERILYTLRDTDHFSGSLTHDLITIRTELAVAQVESLYRLFPGTTEESQESRSYLDSNQPLHPYGNVSTCSNMPGYNAAPLQATQLSTHVEIQRSRFDSRRYHIFWEVVGLERSPLSLVSTIEELLGRKSSGSGLESRDYGRRDPSRWPHGTFYP